RPVRRRARDRPVVRGRACARHDRSGHGARPHRRARYGAACGAPIRPRRRSGALTGRSRGVLAAFLILSACGPGSLVRHGHVNEALVEQVQERLVATRHLEFRQPVPVRALGPAEVAAAVNEELAQSFPPGDLKRTEEAYVQLGLLPPGTQLEPALRQLFTTQLAAFYSPRTKELAVATRAVHAAGGGPMAVTALTGRDVVGELVLAHELTHALQDQTWGLPVETEPSTDSHTDRVLARRALLEGDATWASF